MNKPITGSCHYRTLCELAGKCTHQTHCYPEDATVPAPNPKAARAVADDKAPLDLLEPIANEETAKALKTGADKYGRRNFAAPDTQMLLSTYIGSLMRHAAALQRGELLDPDSGLSHFAHIGANVHVCMASIEAGTMRFDTRDTQVTERNEPTIKAELKATTVDVRGHIIEPSELIDYPHGTVYINAHIEPFVVQAACCLGDDWDINSYCVGTANVDCSCGPAFPAVDQGS